MLFEPGNLTAPLTRFIGSIRKTLLKVKLLFRFGLFYFGKTRLRLCRLALSKHASSALASF
jgi:hypothetical protein